MKVNWEKNPKIIFKNMEKEKIQEFLEMTKFKQEKQVKYLGIYMTNKSSTLMEDNYMNLLSDISKNFKKLDNLQLSFMGRIVAIKMSILPRVLFLFQTIPIILKQAYFQELSKTGWRFVWQGKKPRLRLKAMQYFKQKAGFGLSDWVTYFKACVLVWIKEWMTLSNERFLKLEGHNLSLSWRVYLRYQKLKGHTQVKR